MSSTIRNSESSLNGSIRVQDLEQKELEASGNDGKAVGSIKLVYSEKLLINTDPSSQYNIAV